MFNSSPRHLMSIAIPASALALMLACCGESSAQVFQFTINSPKSEVNSSSSLQAPVPGTVIGSYDATANPTGTMTRPGLFGGSGNVAIPFNITFVTGGDFNTQPAGSFTIDVNQGAASVSISNLNADLLNGSPASQDLTLNLLYSNFHTLQPSSIFPGGITIPLPLGQANLTLLTLVQTGGRAAGALKPAGRNTYTFSIIVPADLTMQADAMGQPISLGPVPAPIAFNGTIILNGNTATANVTLEFSYDQTTPGPFPGGTFTNVALDVPTVIPSGSTAHLLFNGELQSIAATLDFTGKIVADGHAPHPGDVNNDQYVNTDDLLEVINHWGACPAPCPADTYPNGYVNVDDLLVVLSNWSSP